MNHLFSMDYCDSQGRPMPEMDMTVFDSEKEAVDYYFEWYRKHGYPSVELSDYCPEAELRELKAFDETSLIHDEIIEQSMLGCGFLWSFFPHWIDVPTWNDGSLADNWNDDKKLRSLMKKTYRFCMNYENAKWSVNRIRQNAKVYCSKQAPSNFRPTVAKYLYNAYGDYGSVYDPCGGWGGRLFGFMASNARSYVCCEPSTKTAEGLNRMKQVYAYIGKDVEIKCECAEDYIPKDNVFDMAFTSPPYFDTEKYSSEPTQSYLRYPKYGKWIEGFLKPVIQNCHKGLKDCGYLLLNVANTKTAPTLEKDTVSIARETGFELKEVLQMVLSSIAGKGIKTEPVFVFEAIK